MPALNETVETSDSTLLVANPVVSVLMITYNHAGYLAQAIEGVVESLAPASGAQYSMLPPENATGNFTKIVQRVPVRIRVPADVARTGILRPGMSVVVDVDTRTSGN